MKFMCHIVMGCCLSCLDTVLTNNVEETINHKDDNDISRRFLVKSGDDLVFLFG